MIKQESVQEARPVIAQDNQYAAETCSGGSCGCDGCCSGSCGAGCNSCDRSPVEQTEIDTKK